MLENDETAEATEQLNDETETELEKTPEGDGESVDEIEEVEVVKAGDEEEEDETDSNDDAEPKKRRNKRPPKKVRKLLHATRELTSELETSNAENAALKAHISQLQGVQPDIQRAPVGDKMPTLEDFSLDENQHSAALENWYNKKIDNSVTSQIQQLAQATNKQQQEVLAEKRHSQHYESADQLHVSDYEESEATAVKLLGNDLSREVVNRSKHSAKILYYFGKHPQEAVDFANLAKHDPVGAAVELGDLGGSLNIRPKVSSGRSNPESKIEGSAATKAPSGRAFQKRYDKAVEEASENGNINEVQKVKREAKAAGVKVT